MKLPAIAQQLLDRALGRPSPTVWPCLYPHCPVETTDPDEIRRHENEAHPMFMEIFREVAAEQLARDEANDGR